MSPFRNFPHVHVVKESKSRTQLDNMNWYQGTSTAEKEDKTDSTADKITATFTSMKKPAWPRGRTSALRSVGIAFDFPRGRRNMFSFGSSDQLSVASAVHLAC